MREHDKSAIGVGAGLGLALLLLSMSATGQAQTKHKMHVVIVANNESLDEDVQPLRFADDDGAKFFELFEASGASVTLLGSLDPDAMERFPRAHEQSMPPTRGNLLGQIQKVYRQIQTDNRSGYATQFVFVYTGHGNVGPNREGYINLADERFTRSDLYHEVLSKSPATFNHLILDACHSYFFVKKRGGGDDKLGDYGEHIRAFLAKEELSSYPNTGVILASSSESETHEWSRLESGIFSHELVSCLVGTGDVDGDGLVTYDETAACIEAANHSIKVSRARLKVFYQAPLQNKDEPLMRLASFEGHVRLNLPAQAADRYYIEDARGVRVADLNYTSEQPLSLALVGERPFFLMSRTQEAIIDLEGGDVSLAQLEFGPKSTGHKGAVERSFRKHLFETPFGKSFMLGLLANRSNDLELAPAKLPEVELEEQENTQSAAAPEQQAPENAVDKLRIVGFTSLGLGIGTGLAGGLIYLGATQSFADYEDSGDFDEAQDYKDTTENRLLAARILLGSAIGFTALGSVFLIVRGVRGKKERESASKITARPFAHTADGGLVLGVSGKF